VDEVPKGTSGKSERRLIRVDFDDDSSFSRRRRLPDQVVPRGGTHTVSLKFLCSHCPSNYDRESRLTLKYTWGRKMPQRTRILIAEDHTLVAELFKTLLENEFEVVAIVGNGRAMIRAAVKLKPDLALVECRS